MLKKGLWVSTLGAAFFAMPVFAEQPSYNDIDVGYLQVDLDESVTDNLNGYFINVRAELGEMFFVEAGYYNIEDTNTLNLVPPVTLETELSAGSLGLGAHFDLGESFSLYGTVSYIYADADAVGSFINEDDDRVVTSAGASENGYGVGIGVRGYLVENFEIFAEVDYADIGEEDGANYAVGAVYEFYKNIGALVKYELDDDSNATLSLGVRLTF